MMIDGRNRSTFVKLDIRTLMHGTKHKIITYSFYFYSGCDCMETMQN